MDTNEIRGEAAKRSKWLKDELLLCARRVVRSDFQTEHATEIEKQALASAETPITEPLVQDFVAWRRSVLWIAALFIVVYAAFQVIGFKTFEDQMKPMWEAAYNAEKAQYDQLPGWQRPDLMAIEDYFKAQLTNFGEGNAEIIDGIEATLRGSVAVAAAFVLLAATRWKSVRQSRKWSRVGWLVMFGVPFLVLLLPITSMMDFSHIPNKAVATAQKAAMGAGFAIGAFVTIAPKAIALFPGIIRSSMSLKTLIPESATPGWVAAIMAPFYAIFLILIVSVINQVHGDLLLVGGIVCFMIGPLVFVWKAEQMVRPHSAEETTSIVAGIRRQASLFTIIGTVLLGIFILRLPGLSLGDAIGFMSGVVGNVLLMTVVAADLVLALLYYAYRQSRAFAGTELEASLDQKFEALHEVGFTQIRTMGAAAVPNTDNASADESTDA